VVERRRCILGSLGTDGSIAGFICFYRNYARKKLISMECWIILHKNMLKKNSEKKL
jgi:hypothetical protein